MRGISKSAAARKLGISRSTVQRYCRHDPLVAGPDGISMCALQIAIAQRKESDGRGFPLGKKRHRALPLQLPRRAAAIFRRPLGHRIEIIGREIDAMTDSEQQQMLTRWLPLFRPQNVRR